MKSALKSIAKKKGLVASILIAAVVMVTLPSCKHQKGGCDAYQGSTRSFHKR